MATIQISGRIGKEVEVKQINDKLKVSTFSVAESRSVKKGNERDYVTDWFRVKMFSDMSWLQSGDVVIVSGKIINNNYEDKDGNKVYNDEIIGNEITLLYRKKDNHTEKPKQTKQELPTHQQSAFADAEDDLPF